MELYERVSYEISKKVTTSYSTSFSSSTSLFPTAMRKHIYAIYGLVRIADEIVDTYRGSDAAQLLKDLENEVYAAIDRQYSTNPVVHSFALTAAQYSIDTSLIEPFFNSMTMDLSPKEYNETLYEAYIYGSAEVVGLMCLRVFIEDNDAQYKKLEDGARALGSAYQKVNFLRDMQADYKELGRLYFPGVSFETFDEQNKETIINDIEHDFIKAKRTATELPVSSRPAVELSIAYYDALLQKIKETPADVLKTKRVRIPNSHKALLLLKSKIRRGRRAA